MSVKNSDVYLEKLEDLLEELKNKDDFVIEANNLVQEIEPHFVIDWYKKDSASARIRSYLRRYLVNKKYNGDTTELVNRIFQALVEVHKSENDKDIEFDSNDEIDTSRYPETESDNDLDIDKYIIILDSNFLFSSYQSGGDFCKFKLNKNFNDLVEDIEELDIYEYVKIGIPDVVWNELKVHKKFKFENEINKIKSSLDRYTFPGSILNIKINDEKCIEYDSILEKQYKEYLNELKDIGTVDVESLSYEKCSLERISTRAFLKEPPFEGKDKKSDKGFKDALIWESIIEYKKQNMNENIIYLSNDKGFNGLLISEFKEIFDEEINIVNMEEKNIMLEGLAREIFSKI